MPYYVATEVFQTKECLTKRCREILAATADGVSVPELHLPFLFALFQYHSEWESKSNGGVTRITTQTTVQKTRCFVLERANNTPIDISFPHAIKCIPSTRKGKILPQKLIDYRNAARTAIKDQIRHFRDLNIGTIQYCPINGVLLTKDNSAVDHIDPLTFDRLLFDFTRDRGINPLTIAVGSFRGTNAVFEDENLRNAWAAYHQQNANLRLLSRIGHAQLPTKRIDWSSLLELP